MKFTSPLKIAATSMLMIFFAQANAGDLLAESQKESLIGAPLSPSQTEELLISRRCITYSADVVNKSRGSTRSYSFTCPSGMYAAGLTGSWSSLTYYKREGQFLTCCGK